MAQWGFCPLGRTSVPGALSGALNLITAISTAGPLLHPSLCYCPNEWSFISAYFLAAFALYIFSFSLFLPLSLSFSLSPSLPPFPPSLPPFLLSLFLLESRLTWNSHNPGLSHSLKCTASFCLSFLSPGIMSMDYHAWLSFL